MSAKAARVVSRSTNICACVSATGATAEADCARAREERADARLRVGDVAHHALEPGQQRLQGADRLVEVRAAAGQRVAELDQVGLDVLLGRLVEGAEQLVELDRLGRRRRQRQRRARREALIGGAAVDLQVLEAERRARPDDHRRVHRQRIDGLVELQGQRCGDRPVVLGDRLDRLDDARPGRRRSGPRCRGRAPRRRAPARSAGRSGRTAGRCWRCRRGRPRGP